MTQNREPPAFQEYAAQMMGRFDFRALSLQARGLLYTLRLECWVNRRVPADPARLAPALGYPVDQIEAALLELQPFFEQEDGYYRCPELDDYRAHLADRHERQSKGGKAGAERTNASKLEARSATPTSRATATPRARRGSLVQPRPSKPSSEQPNSAFEGDDSVDAWVAENERASRGF